MLEESDDQHGHSATTGSGESLEYCLLHCGRFDGDACGGDRSDKRLEQRSRQTACHSADNTVSNRAETVFLHCVRSSMRAQNASDYLDDQICECPSHPTNIANEPSPFMTARRQRCVNSMKTK